MRCFGDVSEKTSTSMFLTMFFKMQNIGQTMHLTMLIAHPYYRELGFWVVIKRNLRKISLEYELFSFATDTVRHLAHS